ncbi:MAG: PrgI family protein [Candidatus Giovannonibacteria bacterium]|nr:MAG: PrgI family protein [Candidatus Giovannonibacteria bacterium]
MQHQVPQFIDIEDKIFGPLTAKQFFYMLGGAAIIFLMYVYLQLWLVIFLGAPVAAFTGALAFLKINGQPFIKVLAAALNYSSSARLYLWKKTPPSLSIPPGGKKPSEPGGAPKLTQSKLQDLSWSLDIQKQLKR